MEPVLHQFAHGPNAVREALAAVRAFCAAHPATDGAAVALIVEELVANMLDHSGGGGSAIELGLACDGGDVRLTLSDAGAPFDPRDAPAIRALPPARGGGAGLALVRAFARIEFYMRIEGRNHLRVLVPARVR